MVSRRLLWWLLFFLLNELGRGMSDVNDQKNDEKPPAASNISQMTVMARLLARLTIQVSVINSAWNRKGLSMNGILIPTPAGPEYIRQRRRSRWELMAGIPGEV
jgi:hypothetical protein